MTPPPPPLNEEERMRHELVVGQERRKQELVARRQEVLNRLLEVKLQQEEEQQGGVGDEHKLEDGEAVFRKPGFSSGLRPSFNQSQGEFSNNFHPGFRDGEREDNYQNQQQGFNRGGGNFRDGQDFRGSSAFREGSGFRDDSMLRGEQGFRDESNYVGEHGGEHIYGEGPSHRGGSSYMGGPSIQGGPSLRGGPSFRGGQSFGIGPNFRGGPSFRGSHQTRDVSGFRDGPEFTNSPSFGQGSSMRAQGFVVGGSVGMDARSCDQRMTTSYYPEQQNDGEYDDGFGNEGFERNHQRMGDVQGGFNRNQQKFGGNIKERYQQDFGSGQGGFGRMEENIEGDQQGCDRTQHSFGGTRRSQQGFSGNNQSFNMDQQGFKGVAGLLQLARNHKNSNQGFNRNQQVAERSNQSLQGSQEGLVGGCQSEGRTLSFGEPLKSPHVKPIAVVEPSLPEKPQIAPELAMPVFQTLDRSNPWENVKKAEGGAGDGERHEREEQWAWGTGTKWIGAPEKKTKMNLYSGPPRAEMFDNAAKVSGGFGEKMLQKMGWKEGKGLGKGLAGTKEPIKFSDIKTDRKGLDSCPKVNDHEKNLVVEDEEEDEEEMTWAKIKSQKEIDRSDPKAVFSEMKSKSFWSWHDTGMTGPENVSQRLRMQKKERKAKEPLNLSAMHPVSALGELCQKRGWKEPFYK